MSGWVRLSKDVRLHHFRSCYVMLGQVMSGDILLCDMSCKVNLGQVNSG
jgi:hypothetical protein